MPRPITVLKFGSSVLTDLTRLSTVVHEIYRTYRQGQAVVVVVSAIGKHTNLLLAQARQLSCDPSPSEALAELLGTGERQSAALLTIGLERAGIPSTLLDPASIGLRLVGDRLDAIPVSLNIEQIQNILAKTPVAVLPGFIGVAEDGGTALMGRGGSDLTAAFLAEQLSASECRLVKDVDGIYTSDPAGNEISTARYGRITYDDALAVAGPLVQPKAVKFLAEHQRRASVAALLSADGTVIGAANSVTDTVAATDRATSSRPTKSPLKVLLLGFGTVGKGVWAHLRRGDLPFEVIGVCVRDLMSYRDSDIPAELLDNELATLAARPHDIVVELTGDEDLAERMLAASLGDGKSVVTANKALVAHSRADFEALARQHGAHFRYSAAVGGAAPMLEAVKKAAQCRRIRSLRGVLNSSTNIVLDHLQAGGSLQNALADAEQKGFTEGDSARDLSGQDAEDKLRILAGLAFGERLSPLHVQRHGIDAVTPAGLALASGATSSRCLRLVASVDANGSANILPELLCPEDYLCGTRGEENRLVIEFEEGPEECIRGKGAGQWPTAEAVVADLLDIYDVLRDQEAAVSVAEYTGASAGEISDGAPGFQRGNA